MDTQEFKIEAHVSDWKREDEDLQVLVDEVRQWMKELCELGEPHFNETGTRLQPLREQLVHHFQRESQILKEFAEILPDCGDFAELNVESTQEHAELLTKLDALMEKLGQDEPQFESWQQAMAEVERFVTMIEEHEREESATIEDRMSRCRNSNKPNKAK